ncbi:MAG: hypothetical protein INR70_37825 [Parafilimonas terrae]|nr:hypothetical protein [Parafilimonas terrae]
MREGAQQIESLVGDPNPIARLHDASPLPDPRSIDPSDRYLVLLLALCLLAEAMFPLVCLSCL